jgi:hypothetical protein
MSQPNPNEPNNATPPAPSTSMFQTPRPARLPLSAFVHPDHFIRQSPVGIETIEENDVVSDHEDVNDNSNSEHTTNPNTNDIVNIQSVTSDSHQQQNQPTANAPSVNLEQMNQYIFQIEQQKNMLELQLKQQHQEIANLKYQQAWHYHQQNQQPSGSIHQQLFKSLSKPDVFRGNAGDDLDAWLAQIINYIRLTGIPLNMAAQFASTYLKDAAWTWFSSLTAEQSLAIVDLDSFVSAITKRFKPLDNQHLARIKLQSLVQSGSVAKYNELFNSLMQQLPKMDVEDRKFQYMDKLKDNIQTALAATVQPDHSLHAIQLMALKLDSTLFHQRKPLTIRRTSGPVSNTPSSWSNKPIAANVISTNVNTPCANKPNTSNDANGQENEDFNDSVAHVNNMNGFNSFVPKLTPEIREQCRKHRLCFRCRKPGHLSINCPTFNGSSFNSFHPSAPISKK